MKTLLLLLFVLVFISCKENNSQEKDFAILNERYLEIKELSESVDCEDSSEWNFTAYGSKACGGPIGYIAYSSKIDTVHFFKLIEEYTKENERLNIKWGVISDCSTPQMPIVVECQSGIAVFIYDDI